MTISLSDNNPRVSYTVAEGVTQTAFTVNFEFFDDADLNFYVDGTLKTLTTHYTVTGGSGATGTINTTAGNSVTGITGGSTVVITRSIAFARTTDFPSSGAFEVATLNTELDRFTAIAADINDDTDRSIHLADDDESVSTQLPLKADRLGKVLGFNATTGAVEAGPTIADVSSLSEITADISTLADIEDGTDATDAIQTVAGISSDVTTVAGIDSNVTTVAGIETDITNVAADQADIGIVSTNINSVNTVATNIDDVITVANDLNEAVSELETVANDLNEATSEIDTVANSIANVDTVGTNIDDVTTVAGQISPTNNIATVAGDSTSINTVAGDSTAINTVAGDSTAINAVANDATDIGNVSTSITDVNTVAGQISPTNNIATVASVDADITTVAGQINPTNNIATVAGISSDVTAVSAISADVSAVEDIKTNVTTVAGVSSDVTTVAGISGNVTTVAGISSNVTTVAGISANVTTVAGDTTAINAVASDATDIGTVATNIANVNTVAGISANVTTVAGDTTNIGTLATDLTGSDNIGTVAGSISNVNSVGGSIANVNTVASNISSVNSFADTYRIGTTDPTDSTDTGDLFYNTTSSTLKVYTGSAWEQGVTAGSGFLPLTGGGLTGNLTFGDNDKAIFGAGSDLQIYHDGTNSRIADAGTGNLYIEADGQFRVIKPNTEEVMIKALTDAAVTLYYDNAEKLATTSTGIDVTGVITTDGMTTSADINFGDNDKAVFGASSDLQIWHNSTGGYSIIRDAGSGDLYIEGSANIRLRDPDGRQSATFTPNGAQTFYHANSQKLATTSTGIDVTGNITVSGTVDGRDVASDGSKLDGIASSADNYSSWTISDGSTSEAISSGNTLTIAGGGDTSTSYDTGTNTLTVTTNAPEAFPAGTSMLFQQTSAPTGWTKQTAHNDKALRLTTGTVGTGGSSAFSTAFATPSVAGGAVSGDPGTNQTVSAGNLAVSISGSISNTTLTTNQIPSHNHVFYINGGNVPVLQSIGGVNTNNQGTQPLNQIIKAEGGSGSHNHGHNLSGSMTGSPTLSGNVTAGNLAVGASTASINVNYVDFIIANKD